MSTTYLDKILGRTRLRVDQTKQLVARHQLEKNIAETQLSRLDFAASISVRDQINIIAEFKRSSPSRGVLNTSRDPVQTAEAYTSGGAAAISVVTDPDFFGGSLNDLQEFRRNVKVPLLRKDFVIDEYQIFESAAAGADAILLIVAALPNEALNRFHKLACDRGLGVVVEVHDRPELDRAVSIGATMIGVNNRDLRTFNVSLDVSRDLIEHAPGDTIMISESGLSSRDDLLDLQALGYSAFLIGEKLMRSDDPTHELRRLRDE